MNKGFIKLHRGLRENEIWKSEAFTRAQAWVDLLFLANFKDRHIRVRGIVVPVKRGQVARSEDWLAAEWKWSRGKVRRFLEELENLEHMIVQQKNRVISLITIVNYEFYNSSSTTDDTTKSTTNNATDGTSKEEVKEDNDIYPLSSEAVVEIAIAPVVPLEVKAKNPWPKMVSMPPDFGLNDEIIAWAAEHNHDHIEEHMSSFKHRARAKGYKNVDWDEAFKLAVQEDWAQIRATRGNGKNNQLPTQSVPRNAAGGELKVL